MARRPPQSAILRRSESRKRNRQKRRQRNRTVPEDEVRPELAPGGQRLVKKRRKRKKKTRITYPSCWVCLSDTQELESSNPPVRWYQNKFCICTGSLGTICEICIRKLPFEDTSRDMCPNCKTPWKKEDLRIGRVSYTVEEFEANCRALSV